MCVMVYFLYIHSSDNHMESIWIFTFLDYVLVLVFVYVFIYLLVWAWGCNRWVGLTRCEYTLICFLAAPDSCTSSCILLDQAFGSPLWLSPQDTSAPCFWRQLKVSAARVEQGTEKLHLKDCGLESLKTHSTRGAAPGMIRWSGIRV